MANAAMLLSDYKNAMLHELRAEEMRDSMNRGIISIESQPGRGSVFSFTVSLFQEK